MRRVTANFSVFPQTGFVSLLFFAAFLTETIAIAQSGGTLTPTGNLTTPRTGHHATLLTNGKVLITGGWAGSTTWASTELYDPVTGTFTPTGDMSTARYCHTATLLPNGKVLIAGGQSRLNGTLNDAISAVAATELYDASTKTFSPAGNMTQPRACHTATLLNTGQVLIAGGSAGDGNMASAELYDPIAGTFTATGDMTEPGCESATLLANGQVLITRSEGYAGVKSVGYEGVNHAELYDPATGTFTRTGSMVYLDQGIGPAAVLLPNGRVLMAGGSFWEYGFSAHAELFDPATGAFTPASDMTEGLTPESITLLGDGTVFIAGEGFIHATQGLCCTSNLELYDAGTSTFISSGNTPAVAGQTATLLPDGNVLISGGWLGYPPASLSLSEIYHPANLVPAPVLLSLSADEQGQGAIQHSGTSRIASAIDPAVAGEYLSIYLTGLVDGSVIPPQVAIGGQVAGVTFFGSVPGYPGLDLINVRMPSGVAPGPVVQVRLTYLSRPSNVVTIGVR